jgi:hypothetical protein
MPLRVLLWTSLSEIVTSWAFQTEMPLRLASRTSKPSKVTLEAVMLTRSELAAVLLPSMITSSPASA